MVRIHAQQRLSILAGGTSSMFKKVVTMASALSIGFLVWTSSWDHEDYPYSITSDSAVQNIQAAGVNVVACDDDNSKSTTTMSHSQSSSTTTPSKTFLEYALKTKTDKVQAHANFQTCLNKGSPCTCKECENPKCAPWGHFYDTIYDRWLAPYARDNSEPIQFLEIGFYTGLGYEAYSNFLPRAELHSMEIRCEGEHGSAQKHPNYAEWRKAKRLHCGDATRYQFLHNIWTTEMKRKDAPPLKVVIDDASHQASHMATSLFFWLPRIEPGGIFIVEDIQPLDHVGADAFRLKIIPQVMKDLHWCGDPALKDTRCFPSLQPFIAGVHCEMHICVFIRNDAAAIEPDEAASRTPVDAFTKAEKCLFGPH